MSVRKRVSDAIAKMDTEDPEGALFQICAAIDATASLEAGKSGRASYKDFIQRNLGLITRIAFWGPSVLNMRFAFMAPNLETDANGMASIQDILYHVVRCGLYHDAQIRGNLQFIDERKIQVDNGQLMMSSSLIYGLIAAVVVSPVNKEESCPTPSVLNLGAAIIPLNRLWGCKQELQWLLDAILELRSLPQSQAHQASGAVAGR